MDDLCQKASEGPFMTIKWGSIQAIKLQWILFKSHGHTMNDS